MLTILTVVDRTFLNVEVSWCDQLSRKMNVLFKVHLRGLGFIIDELCFDEVIIIHGTCQRYDVCALDF